MRRGVVLSSPVDSAARASALIFESVPTKKIVGQLITRTQADEEFVLPQHAFHGLWGHESHTFKNPMAVCGKKVGQVS